MLLHHQTEVNCCASSYKDVEKEGRFKQAKGSRKSRNRHLAGVIALNLADVPYCSRGRSPLERTVRTLYLPKQPANFPKRK